MKIKLLEQLAIHEIQRETIASGTVVELLDAHAKQLIDRGLAEAATDAKAEAPVANKKAAPLANKSAPGKRGR